MNMFNGIVGQSSANASSLSSKNFSQTFRTFQECITIANQLTDTLVFQAIITPSDAQKILANNNSENRNMRLVRVSSLEKEMKEGKWVFNGDAIRLASDLTLIDGQHRLQAAVNADFTMRTVLMLNLPKETFKTIDIGANRTYSDMITVNFDNPKYPAKVSAACISLFNYYRMSKGISHSSAIVNSNQKNTVVDSSNKKGLKPDINEMIGFLEKTPKFISFISDCAKVHSSKRPTCIDFHLFASLKWVTDQIDENLSNSFWNAIITQNPYQEETAKQKRGLYYLIWYLRRTKQRDHEKLVTNLIRHYSTIAYCWNMERKGKKYTSIPSSFDELVLFE